MILCCDLPRGKFPYLVFNLVVFGHLVSSCVTQATLETRVCHSRVYFNSHPTPLLSFYPLLSTSPPYYFLPSIPNLPLFPMSTQSPPLTRKTTTGSSQGVHLSPLYHIEWIDGAHGNVCPQSLWLEFHPLVLPMRWGAIGLVCTHGRFLFPDPFLVVSFFVKCTQDSGLDFSVAQSQHRPSFYSHYTLFSWLIES